MELEAWPAARLIWVEHNTIEAKEIPRILRFRIGADDLHAQPQASVHR